MQPRYPRLSSLIYRCQLLIWKPFVSIYWAVAVSLAVFIGVKIEEEGIYGFRVLEYRPLARFAL
jgi:hypothetical protein